MADERSREAKAAEREKVRSDREARRKEDEGPKYRKVDKDQMESRVKKGEPFTEMKFQLCDFSRMNLRGAKFNRCTFKKANFTGANLDGVEFQLCDLRDAILKKASLKRTRFPNADCKRADFTDADLEEAILDGAEIEDANFEGANMKLISYRGLNLNEALIKKAKNMPLEYRNPTLLALNQHLPLLMALGVIVFVGWLIYVVWT